MAQGRVVQKRQAAVLPRYNRCILCEAPLSCDRTKNLDVFDLWLDL